MSDGKSLLQRWSDRKYARRKLKDEIPASERSESGEPQECQDQFTNFNFDSLNFSSDFTRFFAPGVPEAVQRKALRKLWISTDLIAETDELADFLEDFREEAMALPAEMVRSAYRIGSGFIDDDAGKCTALGSADRQSNDADGDEAQVPDDGIETPKANAGASRSEKLPTDSDER